MGQNLILNMDSKGFVVCAFNRTVDKVSLVIARLQKKNNTHCLSSLVTSRKLLATFPHRQLTSSYVRHQVTHFLNNEAKGTKIIGATSMEDMVSKLKSPRRVMLLVKGKVL